MPDGVTIQAYEDVRKLLVDELGGTMTWAPGGGPGGVWKLTLRGRYAEVPVRDHSVNDLDRLYLPLVDKPSTWDDFGALRPDAFGRLAALFR
jgi:hypothetical protein